MPMHYSTEIKAKGISTEGRSNLSSYIYFVEKGCLRMYFIDKKLNEQITQFALEHWWMADHFSFIDNKPSPYFIQAIEKSEVLAISCFLV